MEWETHSADYDNVTVGFQRLQHLYAGYQL
jgi:hypothetical protein